MMSNACFVTQEATKEILLRVTNVCGECYSDLHIGDIIHYDMQNYRYLCDCCQQKLCSQMNEECEIVREEDAGLFC
ncbi:hypothetical protein [Sulfurovum sp.]|uniref:hypothetical protein n=1 Tax=Sulfurovum sp. TaxID=1969726 RepID=UPI0025E99596|nr:hypothetical protein [Sulfurovum sp.]